MKTSSQAGSHVIAFGLLVLVVAVVGFAGYQVWMKQQAAPAQQAAAVTVPAKITDKATLSQAAAALDQSSAQLNSRLDSAQLDTYLKAML